MCVCVCVCVVCNTEAEKGNILRFALRVLRFAFRALRFAFRFVFALQDGRGGRGTIPRVCPFSGGQTWRPRLKLRKPLQGLCLFITQAFRVDVAYRLDCSLYRRLKSTHG